MKTERNFRETGKKIRGKSTGFAKSKEIQSWKPKGERASQPLLDTSTQKDTLRPQMRTANNNGS